MYFYLKDEKQTQKVLRLYFFTLNSEQNVLKILVIFYKLVGN